MGRFKATKKEKIGQLVKRSNSAIITMFNSDTHKTQLTEHDKNQISSLLEKYQGDESNALDQDISLLCDLTAEIKSISNQSIILHGERIKKAQNILKKYREGAFSSFLMQTYGNRQTPYNFLLYYELYHSVSKNVQQIIDPMPKQAIYSLSSRDISDEEKVDFIRDYKGETKAELLSKLRAQFPLKEEDKRKAKTSVQIEALLQKALDLASSSKFSINQDEKRKLLSLLGNLSNKVSKST